MKVYVSALPITQMMSVILYENYELIYKWFQPKSA